MDRRQPRHLRRRAILVPAEHELRRRTRQRGLAPTRLALSAMTPPAGAQSARPRRPPRPRRRRAPRRHLARHRAEPRLNHPGRGPMPRRLRRNALPLGSLTAEHRGIPCGSWGAIISLAPAARARACLSLRSSTSNPKVAGPGWALRVSQTRHPCVPASLRSRVPKQVCHQRGTQWHAAARLTIDRHLEESARGVRSAAFSATAFVRRWSTTRPRRRRRVCADC
jgi:hypothetical protein